MKKTLILGTILGTFLVASQAKTVDLTQYDGNKELAQFSITK